MEVRVPLSKRGTPKTAAFALFGRWPARREAMKKAVLALLWLSGGCGGDDAKGGGVTVLRCNSVLERDRVDLGQPPSPNGSIAMVPARPGTCTGGWAAVSTLSADGNRGAVSLLSLQTLDALKQLDSHTDAVVRYHDQRLYVLNRKGADTIQVHEAKGDFAEIATFSAGDGTANIQDICCDTREKCFVPRLDDPTMLIVNPEAETEEGFTLGSIDLSSLDPDGNPNAASCTVFGRRLAVTLRHLTAAGTAEPPGGVAFFDLSMDPPALLSVLDTESGNPVTGFLHKTNSTALVGQSGRPGLLDGAIESINAETRASGGILLTEEQLGGDLVGFDACTTGQTWAIADQDGNTSLHAVDLAEFGQPGDARPARITTEGPNLRGIVADPCGRVWVTDTSEG